MATTPGRIADVRRTTPTITGRKARSSAGPPCPAAYLNTAPALREASLSGAKLVPIPWLVAPLLVALVTAMSVVPATATPATPALPIGSVDTTYPDQTGKTIFVGVGGDLQSALNGAQLGDTIILEPSAIYTGPFFLPAKTGAGWIVIRTSATLPPDGARVTPSHASLMPKLEAFSGSVINTAPGAHHYRFVGIEIRPASGTFLSNLVLLGYSETSVDQLPHHIVFDRCYLHGDLHAGTRRGIAMNGSYQAVIESYLADFKEWGADSQAVGGWAGPGPFKIANNYLEGARENVMFGGADPIIRDVVPSDIEIRENHIAKPLTWRVGDPTYAGTPKRAGANGASGRGCG